MKAVISMTLTLKINTDMCNACGECIKVCATKALVLNKTAGKLIIKNDRCAGCGACIDECKTGALSFE